MEKIYQYIKEQWAQPVTVTITDSTLTSYIDEANDNYAISKGVIDYELIHVWNWSLRAYHMGVKDREIKANLKQWQSNIAFWLIRSFIDVFISTLTEKPVAYAVKWLTEDGITNAPDILHMLATSADVTGFQNEARIAMNEALKVDVFSFEVGILPEAKQYTYTVIEKGEDWLEKPVEYTYTNEVWSLPFAKYVPAFELFPDPSSNNPSYVTRRALASSKNISKMFTELINSKENKSPLKDMLPYIVLNENGADKNSYDTARSSVHRDYNLKFRKTDLNLTQSINGNVKDDSSNTVSNSDIQKNLIEYKYYTTDEKIVLHLNNYPVYIWPNPFEFIPFEIMSASDPQYILDCEGVPYKLAGLSETFDSFLNNYIDSARSIAAPTFIALKNSFLDEESLKSGTPWQVLFAETEAGANAIRRLEKGTVSDFNLIDIIIKIASQITGISEYNLGWSTKERTATGALATTQASLKRLSPFLVSFITIMSKISQKQLKLARQFMPDETYFAASGQNPWQEARRLSKKNIAGAVDVSLQIDSMQSAIDEFGYKKLTEVWNQMAGRWLLKENEVAREIFKSQWYDPNRFVPSDAPNITTSPDGFPPPLLASLQNPEAIVWQELAAAANSQIDLGNEWEWRQ